MVRLSTRTALGLAVALGTSALLGAPAHALVFKTTLGPEVVGATGSGNATLLIDEVTNNMYIDVNFQCLSGSTTVSHIHGPTASPLTGTAGVMTTTPTFGASSQKALPRKQSGRRWHLDFAADSPAGGVLRLLSSDGAASSVWQN